jgi:hypothetical protein
MVRFSNAESKEWSTQNVIPNKDILKEKLRKVVATGHILKRMLKEIF